MKACTKLYKEVSKLVEVEARKMLKIWHKILKYFSSGEKELSSLFQL